MLPIDETENSSLNNTGGTLLNSSQTQKKIKRSFGGTLVPKLKKNGLLKGIKSQRNSSAKDLT
jgi:ribosomal protein L34E